MFDNIATQFYQDVIKSYYEYEKIKFNKSFGVSQDLRAAIRSAISLYHFREHLPKNIARNKSYFINACRSYGLIGDIANVSKHSKIDRRNPAIHEASQIVERMHLTLCNDRKEEYKYATKHVIAALDDGTEVDLYPLLNSMSNFWIIYLFHHKKIKNPNLIPTRTPRPRRESDDGAAQLGIEMMAEVDFKLQIKFFRESRLNVNKLSVAWNSNSKVLHVVPEDQDVSSEMPLFIDITNEEMELINSIENKGHVFHLIGDILQSPKIYERIKAARDR